MRKSTFVVAMGAIAAMGFAGSADATVILFDNFEYADGSLINNAAWDNHSGVSGDLLVSSEQAVVEHGTPSEDANTPFAAVAGTIYYGLDFSIDDLGHAWAGSDSEYFASFREGFNLNARLDVSAPTGAGDYTVGIATSSGTANDTWATDLTYGTTYRAVVEYDQAGGTSKLWIDAVLSTDTSILGGAGDAESMVSFALRQSDSTENETVRVDNLVVGTTFEDVVTAVPEPASLALLGLGGLAMLKRR